MSMHQTGPSKARLASKLRSCIGAVEILDRITCISHTGPGTRGSEAVHGATCVLGAKFSCKTYRTEEAQGTGGNNASVTCLG